MVGLVEKVTVSEVAEAVVTVPTAPSSNVTVLFPATRSKPKPLMVRVAAFAARFEVLVVTTGVTVATCTAAPLLIELIVTTAVKLPALTGLVEKVTVSDVAVEAVTAPTAPSLKTTVLLPGVVSKPKPLMVSVAAFAAKFALLLVTTGVTLATCTAAPLLTLLVVTTAVKLPTPAGFVEKVTVIAVAVAAVTVPTALLLKTTVLLPAVVSKPTPLITSVLASAAKLIVLVVTTGFTVATCTAAPLLTLFVVTIAVKLPAGEGLVEKVTTSEVPVEEVTVPTAPLLSTTVLLPAVVSNPKPLIVTLLAFAARFVVARVTTGVTVATCTAACY